MNAKNDAADELERAIDALWAAYDNAKQFLTNDERNYVDAYVDGWRGHHANDITQVMRGTVVDDLRESNDDEPTDLGPVTHVVEASDLGLNPGSWPAQLIFQGIQYFRGEPEMAPDGSGEIIAAVYTSRDDATLTILND